MSNHASPKPLTELEQTASRVATSTDRRARWFVLALLAAAQFMLIIDITVVNVALPSIGKDLSLDRAGLTWVVTAYTLLFGSLLVVGGRLADAFGRRRTFLAGLGLFVAASLASGLASSGEILIASRALQGIGAALLSPAALSLVTTTFTGSERNRALAVWAALGGAGAAVGVILGGVLTSGPGWQWVFFINVPVGAVVALGVGTFVAATPAERGRVGLDLPGAVSFALAIGSLMWAIVDAGAISWTSPAVLVRIAAGIGFLAAFVWRERATAEPLVRLDMLAQRAFSAGVVVMLTGSVILGGMIFLATLYLQLVAGLSAIQTGSLFLPMAIALVAGSQWAAFYIGHHGPRGSATVGFVLASLGALYLSRLAAPGDVLVQVLPGIVVTAAGIGAIFVSATTTAFGAIDGGEAGRASGFVNTAHEVGLALGVALASTLAGPSVSTGVGTAGGFGGAFLAGVLVAVVGVALARLRLPTRASASGRPMFAH